MAFNLTSGQWYTAKYRAEFTGDQGTSRIVEIHEDGYDFRTDGPSSLPNPMTGVGRANVSTSYAREGENEFAALAPSETTLSVYDDFASDSIATDLLNDIQTVSDKYAIVIRDGNTLRWVGKIDPEGIEYQEEGPIPLSVTATCGIGRLANLPYSTATDSTAAAPSGLDAFTDVIADILDGTGFGLDFYVSSSLYHKTSPTLEDTDNPLQNTYVDKLAFSQNDNEGQQKLVSKRAVLEAICNGWGLVCFQFDGAYHLIQADHFHANSYRRWQYNSSGVLQVSGGAVVDPRVTVSDENVKRTVSTKSFLKAYNSAAVSYQHGPIQILQYPDFTVDGNRLTPQEFFGGAYPWSFNAATGPFFVTLGDSGEDQGMKCEAVISPLSDFSGYEAIDVSAISEFQKGAKFANVTQSAALDTALANRVSEQTTGILQSGFNFGITFQAYARTTQKGSFNPHELSDSWVVLKIKHNGQNQYLKVNTSGQLEWTNTETWFAHRNAVAADDWFNAIWRAEDVANTTVDGTITVSIGPIFYDDTNAQIWDSVIWDNFQLFTQLDDGTVNYETTTSINYIDRGDPRTFTNTVVIGDGPTAYNKGSMFSDTDRTVTSDWEESTTGHSGSQGLDHSSALSVLYLKSMRKMRATHTSSYDGYGDVLGPLDVLNRTSGLHPFWSIDIDWIAESTSGTWYQADKSTFSNDLETGISKGAHLLGGLGRGSSGDAGFNYNRIGSSFDTLIARENDRISKVVADPVSGATVTNSGTTVHCEALTDPEGTTIALRHNDSVYFQSVKTGRIIKRLVDASENDPEYSPYVAGAITFKVTEAFTTDEYIEENDPILPGTITGMRIDMDGVSIINTHIKSDGEYAWNGEIDELTGEITAPGDTGWVISKSGGAVFNDVIVRGNIEVGDLLIGKDVGYLSGTPSERIAGEHGIWINGDNYWILDTNADPDEEFFRVGDDNSHINWDGTTGSEAFTIKSQGSIVFDSSSGSGGLGLTGKVQISATGSITDGTNYELGPDGLDFQLPSGPSAATELRWLETLGSTSAGDITLGAWSASPIGRVIEADADTFRLYTNGTLNTATGDGIWADSARYHGDGIVFGGSASEIVGSSAGLYLKSTSGSTSFLWPGNPGNNGDVLTSNGSGGLTFSPASGVSSLNGLSDVNITSATTGDLLRYNGSSWVDYPDSNYAAASHTHAATDITSGTLASARLSGSYTGITGVGALSAGSITSGFGSIATANTISTTSKIYVGGSTYASDGIQLDYNAGNPRFYVGDGADSYFQFDGTTAKLNGGLVTNLASGSDIGIQGWSSDIIFSATDVDTVSWTTGTIKLADGTTYSSISSGNTGNMTALTYIYFDSASPTALATTTTAANAIGTGKILIAVAQKNTDTGATEAVFQAFGGRGGQLLNAASIAANSITANEIAANTITAAQIDAGTITATELASNSVTATKINVTDLSAVNTSTGSLSVTGDLTMNSYAGSEWASAKITSAGDIYANDGYFESLTASSSGLTVYSSTLGPASGTLAYANGVFTVDGDDVISEGSIGNGLSYSSFTLTTDISATSGGGGGVSNGDLLTLTDKNGNTVLVKCEIV